MDRETGQARGFGFEDMASEAAAKKAVMELNGKELQGRTLRVVLLSQPLPDTHALAAIVPLGKTRRQLTKLRRRPVAEFVTHERFNGPAFQG